MKTTVELPDELVREIKVRAAREDRKLKDLVADLLRKGLRDGQPREPSRRVQFPLIHASRTPTPEEVSPERMAQILLDQEVEWLVK